MKTPFIHIIIIYLLILGLLLPFSLKSQHLLSQVEVQGGAFTDCFQYMVHDPAENYYVGVRYGTNRDSIIVGNTTVYAHRKDPMNIFLGLSDYFLLKFNMNHEIIGSFVIDNAEQVRDFYSDGTHTLISMTLYDSESEDSLYPITLGGIEEVEREGNRGKGILVVLDENMNLEKVVIPSTGELGHVAADGDFAYLEVRIPKKSAFILIGSDTVFNQPYINLPTYFDETVVLCKYNLITDEVEWWKRIGERGDEELEEMELDPDKNLVIRGITSSIDFYFDDSTYVVNTSPHNPFIGKYSPDGKWLLGILNPNEVNEYVSDMTVDPEGNFYIASEYYGPAYAIGDTVLFNEFIDGQYQYKGLVVKYDAVGNFVWAHQSQGNCQQTSLFSIAWMKNQQLVISGYFIEGDLQFGKQVYHQENGTNNENGFLWILDAETGAYIQHVMSQGVQGRTFYDMYVDKDNILNMYLQFGGTDTLFNAIISSYLPFASGFLLKIAPDFISALPELNNVLDNFNMYPNPVSGGSGVNITFNDVSSISTYSCAIYDQCGQKILERREIDNSYDKTYHLNTSSLLPGPYWVVLYTKNHREIELLIIE
ncbi:MAG: T9SS type A sorting domain-containing protein [Saprospiraceae bacterium]|uniref:T9SS type A sorting domain-containing protein n=1 Tax=Candidatus Opimibacter skivensis TaxID=2982028 RepID=A0A9D7XT51_9BACT|nr:T9SS type A sorting domain-containing protein [Candidatus Opimibacter skivensis]